MLLVLNICFDVSVVDALMGIRIVAAYDMRQPSQSWLLRLLLIHLSINLTTFTYPPPLNTHIHTQGVLGFWGFGVLGGG